MAKTRSFRDLGRWAVVRTFWQIVVLAAFLAAWQFLPDLGWLSSKYKFLNRFFISSPVKVWNMIIGLLTGQNYLHESIWPYVGATVQSTVAGTAIGLVLGAGLGVVMSNSKHLSDVVQPFVLVTNSIPRVALVPIFIIIAGPTARASLLAVVTVVFFLGFFNAFEGGRAMPSALIDNAVLLGASPLAVIRYIRVPAVARWTFAAVPNAISFGLVTCVTTEILSGVRGMGSLIETAAENVDATLSMAVIVVLVSVALLMYGFAVILRKLAIRWE
jgi:NitT/TauT family transport system permease protein